MKKAIIVDIDNTFLDCREILKKLPKNGTREEWDEFQKLYQKHCPINAWCYFITQAAMDADIEVLFVTGREGINNVVKDTLTAIDCASDPYYHLLMRAANDYRSDAECKLDIYTSFIKDRYDVLFAIDDRESCINMWKSLGIPSLQCFFPDETES